MLPPLSLEILGLKIPEICSSSESLSNPVLVDGGAKVGVLGRVRLSGRNRRNWVREAQS